MNKEILITGEWDGEPIWRRWTAKDSFQRMLDKLAENSTQKPVELISRAQCPSCERPLEEAVECSTCLGDL